MSVTKNTAAAAKTTAPATKAPALHVIEGANAGAKRSGGALVVLVAAIFLLAIVVPLIANTSMAQLSYAVRDMRVELAEEQAQIDSLETQLMKVSSADGLAEKATKVGLVPAGRIGVISLKDGIVEGGVPAQ